MSVSILEDIFECWKGAEMYLKIATAYDQNPTRIAMLARDNRKRTARRLLRGATAYVTAAAMYLLTVIPG
jgi:hypothetical protein